MIFGICMLNATYGILAQTSATANFTASATIIQPITITTTSDMNFANIDAKTGGQIILTPDNIRTSSGGVVLAGEENLSAATFIVTGQSGYTYDISLPEDIYTLSNGIENMVINNFTSSISNGNLIADESQIIRVGATLNVNANQTPGFYSTPAPLNVTVNYN
ncbi:DUF4402 domain-containing protein [Gillisia limnaea]|uniref:DUF4402 domain-containing protein n=2 Tax=Gillisia TaxID=244698 RepID=H2BYL7_GILLR|nr:hypothetical protein Gilli_0424 [Gillisia limnaea DSM 15749]